MARPTPVLTRVGEEELQTRDVAVFLIFGLLAILIVSVLTPIVCTHWPQAARDLTTIERYYTNGPNPYDRGGGVLANLEQVLGECGPDWLIPVAPWRPLSDGFSFARCSRSLHQRSLFGSEGGFAGWAEPETRELLAGRRGLGQDRQMHEQLWRLRYLPPGSRQWTPRAPAIAAAGQVATPRGIQGSGGAGWWWRPSMGRSSSRAVPHNPRGILL
mmetsp:Transcript_77009/g.170592  ORF Transcript_77009/g.170592 Transcript_77009/m.170592 type:complete len:215 (-) Transcript_77009:118-762(-)